MEKASEVLFDINIFQTDLIKMVETFAHHDYPTTNTPEKVIEKYYQEILNFCVNSLLQTNDIEALFTVISSVFVNYRHGCGVILFNEQQKEKFYQEVFIKSMKQKDSPISSLKQGVQLFIKKILQKK